MLLAALPPIHAAVASAAHKSDVVVDADDVALRAATMGEIGGVTGFRVTALGACSMNIQEPVFTNTGRKLHPAERAAKTHVHGTALPVRRAVEMCGACPVEWMIVVWKSG